MPQKTRPDDSFLNFPVNTNMTPVHGDVLSYSTGTAQWTNTSGTNLPFLDGRYLRLDASNSPLTGQLQINPSTGSYGLNVNSINGRSVDFEQSGYNSGTVSNNVLFLSRSPLDSTPVSFTASMIQGQQIRNNGTISGPFIRLLSDGTERVNINPSAQGTGTLVKFDGDFQLSSNGLLLLIKNNGTSQFYVSASGTVYSNDVPLIKEAPFNSGTFSRKNNGWTEELGGRMFLPFGVYVNINPITSVSSPAYPYTATVDRTMTLKKWAQTLFVQTTNNGSHYWTINMYRSSDTLLINTINTSAIGADTITLLTDSTFTPPELTSSNMGIYIECVKTGTPGSLFIYGPILEVQV